MIKTWLDTAKAAAASGALMLGISAPAIADRQASIDIQVQTGGFYTRFATGPGWGYYPPPVGYYAYTPPPVPVYIAPPYWAYRPYPAYPPRPVYWRGGHQKQYSQGNRGNDKRDHRGNRGDQRGRGDGGKRRH